MDAKDAVKILLAGDYPIFRTGLKMLLENEDGLRVVAQADGLAESAALVGRLRPDVILVDESVTDDEGFAAFRDAHAIPFVVLASGDDAATFRRVFGLGASGLLSKERTPAELFRAVRKVAAGELWFDRRAMGDTLRELLVERELRGPNPALAGCAMLSEREKEVLALVCKGYKNKIIADHLFISETTVRHHLTSIFEKLDVSSRLQLVVLAFERNLVEVPAKKSANAGAGL